MAINNSTIELEKSTSMHVILVQRDGVKKFISKDFFSSCFPCTVLINKAKKFNTEKLADKFIDGSLSAREDIKVIKVVEVISTLKLNL